MKTFNLPDLGEGLPEAQIQEWHVQEGDYIYKDQPLAMMETAKASVDVPAPFEGKVVKRFGEPGDTIYTGSPLVGFEDENDQASDDDSEQATVVGQMSSEQTVLAEEKMATVERTGAKASTQVKALPAARALAKKHDLDINNVQASEKEGVITVGDVKRAIEQTKPTEGGALQQGYEPLKGFRKTMARQMITAHETVVPATIYDDAFISHWGQKVDITVRLLRSVIKACAQSPNLNAHFDNDHLAMRLFDEINIGMAVDTEHGLFVPVIKNAEQLTDEELRQQIDHYKHKIKNQALTQSDMEGATITFSNYGTISGRYATPIIVPPTVAIVGVGRLHNEAVPSNGAVQIERAAPISLSFDHRAATGGEAARFLKAMIDTLESMHG